MDAAEEAANEAQAAWERAVQEAEANRTLIAELESEITQRSEETSAAVAEEVITVESIIGNYTEQIDTLSEAYRVAYQAAYDSITGQYKLWDDVAEVSAKSVDDVTTSLQNQKKYWEDYNTNIQTLLGYSGEIEGLSGMVAEFGDGSADSVNMIAGMAEAANSGHPEKIQEMVAAWQENKKAQDEAAQSLGDLVTNYSENMAEIQDELAADVEAMDYSDEAYAAATSTLQSFIDGANDMLPAVQRAYSQIAAVANDALTQSYYRQYYSYRNGRGYASGTDNASPGLHLVGENGPEIVAMHGGEHVLDAYRTQELLNASTREPLVAMPASSSFGAENVNVNTTFQIQGVSSPEDFESRMPEIEERLKGAVLGMLEEIQEDQLRRRM
jgi:flagellar biosynthesis chaperone FliJ